MAELGCDGGCSYGDGPQEECSAHGRTPKDLWGIIGEIAAERDAALSTIAKVEAWVDANREFLPRPMAWEIERALGSVPSTGEGNNA